MTKNKQPINQQLWFIEFRKKVEQMKGVKTELPSGHQEAPNASS